MKDSLRTYANIYIFSTLLLGQKKETNNQKAK